jgi:signal transduction histidine kinase/DNA-binding response OmpR family regulator/HAMP domain-containing protein
VRIFLALACLCAVLLAYGTWSIRAVTEAGEIVRETYDRPFQALNYALKANARFNQMRVVVREGGETSELRMLFLEDLEIAEERVLSETARRQVGEIRRTFGRWLEEAEKTPSSQLERDLSASLVTRFDALTETMTLDSFRERQRALAAVGQSRFLAIAAVCAAVLLAAMLSVLMSRQIARPLRIAARAAEKVSKGDFGAELPAGGRDETGALLQSLRVMQDSIRQMLEREEARTRLAEVRMADALESAGSGVMIHDRAGLLIYANSQARGFFADLRCQPGEAVAPDFLAGICDGKEVPLSHGRWVSTSRSETRDGESIVIWTDISALKTRETALRKAKEEAQAAAVAKSNFLANMSHEIRTPMNGVLGLAEVLQTTKLDERQRELVSLVLSSGSNLMAVINSILDFTKLDAGKMRLSETSFNLRQTVGEVGAMMQASARQKGIELIVRYAPDLPEGVRGDETRIRQVLGNLAGNAVKFTNDGHVLLNVDGTVEGGEVRLRLEVSDTGIGIDEQDLPRMFQKFEQADGSKSRSFEGTGLGLAICKELIDLMGGKITAASRPGEGSCFTIELTLPVDDSVEFLPDTDGSLFKDLRILAVDDNAINRLLLQEFLSKWGIDHTLADSADAAARALDEASDAGHPFELILMDFHMPGESGDSFTGRMQKDVRYQHIPVVMLSSVDTNLGAPEAYEGRYAEWVSKPVGPSKLLDALTKVCSGSASKTLRRRKSRIAPPEDTRQVQEERPVCRVLLAEDNVVNQMVVTSMIRSPAIHVAVAENGKVALELFEAQRPDIVITDLSMPVMDGLTAAQELRMIEARNGWPRTPVIAATAHVLDSDREEVRRAGIDDFIAKPLKKEALLALIEKWRPAPSARENQSGQLRSAID